MAGERVLVVEDEANIVNLVRAYLEREGFTVDAVTDGRAALHHARVMQPHLIVLDLMLPGMDGLEVCRRLRQESDVYILMLTAKSEEADRIVGLELGADDYLTKPFSPRELVARVKAVLRRSRPSAGTLPDSASGIIDAPPLRIDLARRRVSKRGTPIDLTALEFDLLCELASRPGIVYSRAQLLQRVWGYDFLGDERVVDVHIGLLRKKIEDDPSEPELLKTVRGVGYKFDGSS
jgi:two-component system, OmpR family, alkaline phosphatase synthesis response regulator PhoP